MGCGASKAMTDATATDNYKQEEKPTLSGASPHIVEVELKKHRPQCTGMFWRSDPTGSTKLASNNDWPRDNAKLRGSVVTVNGEKWLLCSHVKQKGRKDWAKASNGAAMPFVHLDHYYLE